MSNLATSIFPSLKDLTEKYDIAYTNAHVWVRGAPHKDMTYSAMRKLIRGLQSDGVIFEEHAYIFAGKRYDVMNEGGGTLLLPLTMRANRHRSTTSESDCRKERSGSEGGTDAASTTVL